MPPLRTPLAHFSNDVSRAQDLVAAARVPQSEPLRNDILRAAWMFFVGAADAYFCDAYADVLSRTLRAKDNQPGILIPDKLGNLKVPVTAVIRQGHQGWRWRMAARELMEDQSVLSLERIRQLFNHFFRRGHKIVSQDTIANWLQHRTARSRCFGITASRYRGLSPTRQHTACKDMLVHFEEHFDGHFQRRHDCIHNCDRPRIALQPINEVQVTKLGQDVEFLVKRVNAALLSEFPIYLATLGFTATTRNRVLQ